MIRKNGNSGSSDEPRVANSELPVRQSVTMHGTVEKIIPAVGDLVPEKVQINVECADPLYREIRIDNALQNGDGVAAILQMGSQVDITIETKVAEIAGDGPDHQSTRGTVRILIADDHPIILETVKGILKAHPNFEVVGEARNGQEAVSQAQLLKPDVIVINVMMPKMSGFEAARRIRTHFPDCAIVILSSNKDRQFIQEARKVGANGYVDKSNADGQLIRAIESAVKGGEFFFVQ